MKTRTTKANNYPMHLNLPSRFSYFLKIHCPNEKESHAEAERLFGVFFGYWQIYKT